MSDDGVPLCLVALLVSYLEFYPAQQSAATQPLTPHYFAASTCLADVLVQMSWRTPALPQNSAIASTRRSVGKSQPFPLRQLELDGGKAPQSQQQFLWVAFLETAIPEWLQDLPSAVEREHHHQVNVDECQRGGTFAATPDFDLRLTTVEGDEVASAARKMPLLSSKKGDLQPLELDLALTPTYGRGIVRLHALIGWQDRWTLDDNCSVRVKVLGNRNLCAFVSPTDDLQAGHIYKWAVDEKLLHAVVGPRLSSGASSLQRVSLASSLKRRSWSRRPPGISESGAIDWHPHSLDEEDEDPSGAAGGGPAQRLLEQWSALTTGRQPVPPAVTAHKGRPPPHRLYAAQSLLQECAATFDPTTVSARQTAVRQRLQRSSYISEILPLRDLCIHVGTTVYIAADDSLESKNGSLVADTSNDDVTTAWADFVSRAQEAVHNIPSTHCYYSTASVQLAQLQSVLAQVLA